MKPNRVLLLLLSALLLGFLLALALRPSAPAPPHVPPAPHHWLPTGLTVCEGDPEHSVLPTACWRLNFCPIHHDHRWQRVNLSALLDPIPTPPRRNQP